MGVAKATELHLILFTKKKGDMVLHTASLIYITHKKMASTISGDNLYPCFHGSPSQKPVKLYKVIWLRILAKKWLGLR